MMAINEAIWVLESEGYGIIGPDGAALANMGIVPDGAMVLSTNKKPFYGRLDVHPVQEERLTTE